MPGCSIDVGSIVQAGEVRAWKPGLIQVCCQSAPSVARTFQQTVPSIRSLDHQNEILFRRVKIGSNTGAYLRDPSSVS